MYLICEKDVRTENIKMTARPVLLRVLKLLLHTPSGCPGKPGGLELKGTIQHLAFVAVVN
jgi:hypothetical protein